MTGGDLRFAPEFPGIPTERVKDAVWRDLGLTTDSMPVTPYEQCSWGFIKEGSDQFKDIVRASGKSYLMPVAPHINKLDFVGHKTSYSHVRTGLEVYGPRAPLLHNFTTERCMDDHLDIAFDERYWQGAGGHYKWINQYPWVIRHNKYKETPEGRMLDRIEDDDDVAGDHALDLGGV